MKKLFEMIYKVVTSKYFVYFCLAVSVALYIALAWERPVKKLFTWNISACGYGREGIFLAWTISLSLFYFFAIFSTKEKYKLKILPTILSAIGILLFLVTGILLPPKNSGTNLYLFIHCGFAAAFAIIDVVALFLSMLEIYKKTHSKKILIFFWVTVAVCVVGVTLLCIWPMAGYTELIPIAYTMIILLSLVSCSDVEVENGKV